VGTRDELEDVHYGGHRAFDYTTATNTRRQNDHTIETTTVDHLIAHSSPEPIAQNSLAATPRLTWSTSCILETYRSFLHDLYFFYKIKASVYCLALAPTLVKRPIRSENRSRVVRLNIVKKPDMSVAEVEAASHQSREPSVRAPKLHELNSNARLHFHHGEDETIRGRAESSSQSQTRLGCDDKDDSRVPHPPPLVCSDSWVLTGGRGLSLPDSRSGWGEN
ncbi:12581_t:CDS:2, partial [Acaulospora colombiana]